VSPDYPNYVIVNQSQQIDIVPQETRLSDLLVSLDYTDSKLAVAVNNQIITRDRWSECVLDPMDNIAIFGAIAGG